MSYARALTTESESETDPWPPLYTAEDSMLRVPGAGLDVPGCCYRKISHLRLNVNHEPMSRKALACRCPVILLSLIVPVLFFSILYLTLVLLVLWHLQPPVGENGFQDIVKSWHALSDSVALLSSLPGGDLGADVTPIPCHAHNDYAHRVPLFQALAAGCVSVEADLWLPSEDMLKLYPVLSKDDLLVGHSRSSLKPDRTLKTLYLDPLLTILQDITFRLQPGSDFDGAFPSSPRTSFVLLLDIKEDSTAIWDKIQIHLAAFRDRPILTTWDDRLGYRVDRSLTIVVTGDGKYEDVVDERRNFLHDVFFDAPLHDLLPISPGRPSPYNASNSYFASTSLKRRIGAPTLGTGTFTSDQRRRIREQVEAARGLGLLARYWDAPSWPVSTRSSVWRTLLDLGVGVLSVDDLEVAASWDWGIRGLGYCGLLRGLGGEGICR